MLKGGIKLPPKKQNDVVATLENSLRKGNDYLTSVEDSYIPFHNTLRHDNRKSKNVSSHFVMLRKTLPSLFFLFIALPHFFFFRLKALGLVSAGTNNSRVAQLLRQLSEFYSREASHLFVTRIAQGLNHMGKVCVCFCLFLCSVARRIALLCCQV